MTFGKLLKIHQQTFNLCERKTGNYVGKYIAILHFVSCKCVYVTAGPDIVTATVLTSRSVEIIWRPSFLLANVTGYLISYTTTASYTSGGNVTINGFDALRYTLTNLEENTFYTITVQAINDSEILSASSSEASVTTFTDGR